MSEENAPVFGDVEGTTIDAEAWEAMTVAERSVAAVVAAARRREFTPGDDAALVRALAVAARGEFVPRSQPFGGLHEALWSVWGGERPNGDLWGLLWDPEALALSFVPVGAPTVRCTNLWFGRGDGADPGGVLVDGDNGPAGAAPVLLWACDGEVAEGIRDWCGAEATAAAEVVELRRRLAEGGDEHHSLDELYESRAVLNAYAVEAWRARGWEVVKSRRHGDGELCFGDPGWFIVHVITAKGPASYHYPIAEWDMFDVPEVPQAPEFDGHTTADVHARLRAALPVAPACEATSCCGGAAAPLAVTRREEPTGEERCGAYATPAHERNGAAIGDPGCPLPPDHSSAHALSNELIIQLDAAGRVANGPAREAAVEALRQTGADPAHYDITAGPNGFEAWRRSDAPQNYIAPPGFEGVDPFPSGPYTGE